MYAAQIQPRESENLLTNCQCPVHILAEEVVRFVYIKFYHRANNCCQFADEFHNSIINDKDRHIPSPLITFTCTALRHTRLEWQKIKGVHPKDSRSTLNADSPDGSKCFNYRNDGGKNASCCSATGCMLVTSPCVAQSYIYLMNTWNTLPES